MQEFRIGRRIWIIGSPGSGKSTLSRHINCRLNIPYYELDSFFWHHNWTRAEESQFRERVSQIADMNQWVIDGQYTQLHAILSRRSNTIIWLDFELPVLLYRVTLRTLRRLLTSEQLWNGNRERLRNMLGPNSILPYTIQTFNQVRKSNKALLDSLAEQQVSCIHIKSSKEFLRIIRNIDSL